MSEMRNCFRCGKEFLRDGSHRICVSCGTPKIEPNRTLTLREKQVIALVAKARQNKEIAYELRLSEGTVKQYLSRIFRKLETANRTQLAVWAVTREAPRETA
jgi:DNA-binding NarL/FixJ family response regulator